VAARVKSLADAGDVAPVTSRYVPICPETGENRQMRLPKITAALVAALLAFPRIARADESTPSTTPSPIPKESSGLETHFSVMAGLTQWVLFRGGNLAVEYKVGRLVFEASHGQGLDLNQVPWLALTSAERDAGASVKVPWTTGVGAGFRVTENLHLLIEAKAHHYNETGRDRNVEVDYTTFSVGPSVFYTFHLFKGLFLEPNVRWWPNVASTLSGNEVRLTQPDGTVSVVKAHDFGLFANMNLGYAF
jgi:hypothetical protein